MKTAEAFDPLSDFPTEESLVGRWTRSHVLAAAGVFALTVAAAAAGLSRFGTATPPAVAGPPAGRDVELTRSFTPPPAAAREPDPTPGPAKAVRAAAPRTPSPAPPAAGAGGWVTVAAPTDLEVRENGELVGSTAVPRIMLPVGRHRLEIGSTALGFRETRVVDIAAGRTYAIKMAPPNGRLNINAVPWANVSIDGRDVGQTPLANLSVPIGRHEVVLRHPDMGERRQHVLVTLNAVTRVGVDLSR